MLTPVLRPTQRHDADHLRRSVIGLKTSDTIIRDIARRVAVVLIVVNDLVIVPWHGRVITRGDDRILAIVRLRALSSD